MPAPRQPGERPLLGDTRPPLSSGAMTHAFFEMHMDVAEEAGLVNWTPLHRMAAFLSTEPGKGYLFDIMGTNTASGDQHRVIVMATEDRDGTPALSTTLEEFQWRVPASQGKGRTGLEVNHVSHDPAQAYIAPEQARGLLIGLLAKQTGAPTELIFAED